MCKVLKTCSEFGRACPRIQSWALGCLANLLVCRENRRRLLGPGLEGQGAAGGGDGAERETEPDDNLRQQEGAREDRHRAAEEGEPEEPEREAAAAADGRDVKCTGGSRAGLAGWIHTVLANSERVTGDRDAQYSGIACVREIAAAGPTPAREMRSTGVPGLVGAALQRFGGVDPQLRDQANTALRWLSRGG